MDLRASRSSRGSCCNEDSKQELLSPHYSRRQGDFTDTLESGSWGHIAPVRPAPDSQIPGHPQSTEHENQDFMASLQTPGNTEGSKPPYHLLWIHKRSPPSRAWALSLRLFLLSRWLLLQGVCPFCTVSCVRSHVVNTACLSAGL